MDTVTVVFTNGNIVNFEAQEFEADLTEDRGYLNKYPYKDARGKDSAIYLKPDEVAGVFLLQSPPGQGRAVTTKVPGSS